MLLLFILRVPLCPAVILWRDLSLKKTCTVSSRLTGERGKHGGWQLDHVERWTLTFLCVSDVSVLPFSAAQLLSYPGKNKIPLNYHIVEVNHFFWQATCWETILIEAWFKIWIPFFFQVIFGELFQLPSPPHIDVMYTTLLIELCKLQPGSLPQVVSFIVCVATVYVRDPPLTQVHLAQPDLPKKAQEGNTPK